MSTKKLLLRPVVEKFFVSVSSPLFADGSRLFERFFSGLLFRSFDFILEWSQRPPILETWQAIRFSWQPWFYPRLVAYRYFWFSEGALRENGDSVPKHTGSDHLSDTPLEPSVSRTEPTTTQEDGTSSLPETLKLLADVILWRRNTLLSSKWST